MDSAYPDTRSSDRPRKHKHNSKGKGKSRADTDTYSGAGEGKPMAYNMPPPSSGSTPQGDYYSNYHYDSAPGQPYRTSSYPGQIDYGGQGGYAPSQGESPFLRIADGDAYLSPHKSHDTAPVLLAHHPLPRETSLIIPLKPRSAAPIGTLSHTPENCTSKAVEAGGRQKCVSHRR